MKLFFIYNVDSGKANALFDTFRKLINPTSYSCDLCALTYGIFSERKKWKDFRKKLDLETEFLHKDEFRKRYASKFGYKFQYPIVLLEKSAELEVLISNAEISEFDSVESLIEVVENRLRILS